jgi:CHAD domain-containing protein
MEPARPEKWIHGITADDETCKVARRTLWARLSAVLHYLPLAAEKAGEDVEHVHELRVYTRRATAALRLYADLLPRRRAAWLSRRLKKIRRAANDARDYDVLAQRLAREPSDPQAGMFLDDVRRRRGEAQEAIVAIHERLRRGHRFERRIDNLQERVRPRGKHKARLRREPFGRWATAHLRPALDAFLRAAPLDGAEVRTLHQFRIRTKQLRYVMELLAGAFPLEFRDRLYPTVEALQDRLGEINDHATALARLRRRLEEAGDGVEADRLRALLEKEEKHFEQACDAFREWWTPEVRKAIQDGFEKLVGPCAGRLCRAKPPAWPAGSAQRPQRNPRRTGNAPRDSSHFAVFTPAMPRAAVQLGPARNLPS